MGEIVVNGGVPPGSATGQSTLAGALGLPDHNKSKEIFFGALKMLAGIGGTLLAKKLGIEDDSDVKKALEDKEKEESNKQQDPDVAAEAAEAIEDEAVDMGEQEDTPSKPTEKVPSSRSLKDIQTNPASPMTEAEWHNAVIPRLQALSVLTGQSFDDLKKYYTDGGGYDRDPKVDLEIAKVKASQSNADDATKESLGSPEDTLDVPELEFEVPNPFASIPSYIRSGIDKLRNRFRHREGESLDETPDVSEGMLSNPVTDSPYIPPDDLVKELPRDPTLLISKDSDESESKDSKKKKKTDSESGEKEAEDSKEAQLTREAMQKALRKQMSAIGRRGLLGNAVAGGLSALGTIAGTNPNTGARQAATPFDALAHTIRSGTQASMARRAGMASQTYASDEQKFLKQELEALHKRLLESYSDDDEGRKLANRRFNAMYMQMLRESNAQVRNTLRALWPLLHQTADPQSRRLD